MMRRLWLLIAARQRRRGLVEVVKAAVVLGLTVFEEQSVDWGFVTRM